MGRRAKIYLLLFVVAVGAYWVGIRHFEVNLPREIWLEQAVLYAFAVVLAFAVAEITRALVINGLRIYIWKYRGGVS